MKKLSFLALLSTLLISLPAEGKRPKPLFKTPKYAAGCNNDIYKRGYQMYLTPRMLAGMVAIGVLNKEMGWFQMPTTEDILRRLDLMIQLPDGADLSYIRNNVVYPLEMKGFLEPPGRIGNQLQIEKSWRGKWAVEENLKAFWEIYVASAEEREIPAVYPADLTTDGRGKQTVPPMELADYLILSMYYPNWRMGSVEVYSYIKDQLSYYAHFYPTTPSAVLARLHKYRENGWLRFEGEDPKNRAAGGSLYQFSLSSSGKQAFLATEKFYLRMMAHWMPLLSEHQRKTWFE